MKTITLICLVALCLLATISAEKTSHKHAGKLLKSGRELKTAKLESTATDVPKAPTTVDEEVTPVKPTANRKNKRHGKNKKGAGTGAGAHHQDRREDKEHQHQNGRPRKSHTKTKSNNGHHKSHKQERKNGRSKQVQ